MNRFELFLWVMLALHVLDVLGRMFRLRDNDFIGTANGEILNAICNGGVALWVVWLLAKGVS